MVCSFVPPYLLRQLSESKTLAIDERIRSLRVSAPPAAARPRALPEGAAWVVHTADNGSTLPGRV
ncbi:MAG: peptidase thermolysin, partial [Nocardioides sp.]|nr:peptidase thermolysin [Nocardioides sp.]